MFSFLNLLNAFVCGWCLAYMVDALSRGQPRRSVIVYGSLAALNAVALALAVVVRFLAAA